MPSRPEVKHFDGKGGVKFSVAGMAEIGV